MARTRTARKIVNDDEDEAETADSVLAAAASTIGGTGSATRLHFEEEPQDEGS